MQFSWPKNINAVHKFTKPHAAYFMINSKLPLVGGSPSWVSCWTGARNDSRCCGIAVYARYITWFGYNAYVWSDIKINKDTALCLNCNTDVGMWKLQRWVITRGSHCEIRIVVFVQTVFRKGSRATVRRRVRTAHDCTTTIGCKLRRNMPPSPT